MTRQELLEMNLAQLAEFIRSHTGKRDARHMWMIGVALVCAEPKCKHGTWMNWKREQFPEWSMRYLGYCQSLAQEVDDPDTLAGKPVTAVLVDLGLKTRTGKGLPSFDPAVQAQPQVAQTNGWLAVAHEVKKFVTWLNNVDADGDPSPFFKALDALDEATAEKRQGGKRKRTA